MEQVKEKISIFQSSIDMPELYPQTVNRNSNYKSNGIYFWGKDNLDPIKYLDMINWSPVHSIALKMAKRSIIGLGLEVDNEEALSFFNKYNPVSLKEVFEGMVWDWVLVNQISTKFVANTTGEYKFLYPISALNLRVTTEIDLDDMKPLFYSYSRNWADHRKQENRPKIYPAYNPEEEQLVSVYRWKPYNPNGDLYSQPGYQSAIPAIHIHKEANEFNSYNLVNKFAPTTYIIVPGIMDNPEAQTKIKANVTKQHEGSKKAGTTLWMFPDTLESAPTFQSFQPTLTDGQFIQLFDNATYQILASHQIISGEIIGLPSGGQSLGGDTNKIKTAYEMYYNQVIQEQQLTIIDQLNKCLEIGNWGFKVNKVIPASFEITVSQPISPVTTPTVQTNNKKK